MILKMIIDVFLLPVTFLINLLPAKLLISIASIDLPDIVKWGAYFFPIDCLVLAINSFIFWYGLLIAWSIIEWIYKKIPGIN